MELGERIQELRKAMSLTQSELAKQINISHTQMARYEIKGIQPPADVLKKMADLFGTSIDYLVRGNKNEIANETIQDAELLNHFKQVHDLPEEDRKTLLKVVSAYLRDFRAKQAYAS
jgi:transcriptional regulator with XRE-family HTH domain